MANNSKRKIKVYYQFTERISRFNEAIPMIRISGLYLKANNFNIGDNLEVDISEDKIVISKAPVPQIES